jgi:hypothetical protein
LAQAEAGGAERIEVRADGGEQPALFGHEEHACRPHDPQPESLREPAGRQVVEDDALGFESTRACSGGSSPRVTIQPGSEGRLGATSRATAGGIVTLAKSFSRSESWSTWASAMRTLASATTAATRRC